MANRTFWNSFITFQAIFHLALFTISGRIFSFSIRTFLIIIKRPYALLISCKNIGLYTFITNRIVRNCALSTITYCAWLACPIWIHSLPRWAYALILRVYDIWLDASNTIFQVIRTSSTVLDLTWLTNSLWRKAITYWACLT